MTESGSTIQGFEDTGLSSWIVTDAGFSGQGYRFGVFDLDLKTGELRKDGRLCHLRNQPFQVLAMLLERTGDLVSREEIKTALWADNVDVDVEQGLNYCIKEIRAALGDSADSPRFIQTLPRRGYRFLADVQRVGLAPPPEEPKLNRDTEPAVSPSPRPWWPRLVVAAVAVAVLGMLAAGWPRRASMPPGNDQIRLVVLPFADLSETPQSYLAEGLTDELISSLGRKTQGRLALIARSSSLAYKSRGQDPAAFARELGASYFIEGTVRRQAEQVRVSVSLARSADGTRVWSEVYDRRIGDLLALEREVVLAIGAGVKVAVNEEAGARVDSEAYLAYLRGRFAWNQRTRESLFESLHLFESITRDNPDFALGFAGLADAYAVLMDHGYLSPKDAWLQAKTAAETAVRLDPGLAEAWTNLGMIRGLYEWNPKAAEAAFATASAQNPNYATGLHWQSILFRSEGRNEEALKNLRRARDLDPLSLVIRSNLGGVLLDLGKAEEALKEAESIVSLAPGWAPGQMLLGDVLAHQNRMDEAESAYRRAAESGSTTAKAELGAFYSRTGKQELAASMLEELESASRTAYVSPYLIAVAAAGIDRERAFRALEAAFEERSPALRMLRRDQRLSPLRADPRFGRLLRVLWPEAPAS